MQCLYDWLDCDTDQETDRLLGAQRTDDRGFFDDKVSPQYVFALISQIICFPYNYKQSMNYLNHSVWEKSI